jgi:hypothetical protein
MSVRSAVPLLLVLAGCPDKDARDSTPAGDDTSTGDTGTVDTDDDTGTTPGQDGACDPGFTSADLGTATWDTRFTISGFTGHDGLAPTVYDFATDVDGSLLATGRFQWLGSEAVQPLMRWRDGTWEPARTEWELTPELTGFSAVAVSPEGALALATYDTWEERDGEIWLDDGTGLRSIGAVEGLVRSLAWFDGKLWVAGLFTIDGIEGLATWDGSAWAAAPGGALDGTAFELTVDGDSLLVGGAFDSVGGVAAQNVATWDGTAWTPYDLPGALAVYALARGDDGALYAGGALGNLRSGAGGVSRWNGTGWETVGGGLSMYSWPGVVTDLLAHDGAVDATGCFNGAGGTEDSPDTVSARSVARWDGVDWTALDDGSQGVLAPWFEPLACGDEALTAVWDVSNQRLATSGDTLFLGGSFPGAGGVLSQSVIGYTDGAWVPQGPSGLGLGGATERLAAAGGEGCDVYAMGLFTHAGGVATSADLLHFTGDAWDPIEGDIPADAWCPALAASGEGEVAVGCMEYPSGGGDSIGRVYRVAGDVLEPLEADLGPIFWLSYDADGRLWIAGGSTTGYVARLDGDTVTMVEDQFDGVVTRVDVRGDDDVLVGGSFTHVHGVEASRIASWDGATWTALGEGAPGMVTALARDATHVYASTYDEGAGVWLLGAWDGTEWAELATSGSGVTPQSYFNLNDIQPLDGAVLVAGAVEMDDGVGRGALVYQDGVFTPLGGGVAAMLVTDLQVTGDAVWVANSIAEVGTGDTLAPSVGVARPVVGGR